MTIYNNTQLPQDVIDALPLLGTTINMWRKRHITLHAHPTNPDRIISIGREFILCQGRHLPGTMVVIADDPREVWATALDYIAHGNVYTSH